MIIETESVNKLNELEFNPISKQVALYDKITNELDMMMYEEDGTPRRRFSQVAVASLLGIQQKIANDLIRYGYRRVPEIVEEKQVQTDPIRIVLTTEDRRIDDTGIPV